ncbi:MAG: outer membrane protein assembly factor [Sphingobacteriales bacterium]|nr:MAG: outer membrane protein assembly factor [Sphingobacteriales bacterium]
MQQLFRSLLIVFFVSCFAVTGYSQQPADTTPVSIDPELLNIFNAKVPKKYTIGGIKIAGNRYYDEALVISISGMSVGDEVTIPGGDNFSKAITNLWKQNLFNNIELYITKLVGNVIYIEFNVQERPRLSNVFFKGIRKSEQEDLEGKIGIAKSQVITENRRRTAVENIKKFYFDKGFQEVKVEVLESIDGTAAGLSILTFTIDKGKKIRIGNISFVGNTIPENKLKKQMKGTKEMSHFTLKPDTAQPVYGQKSAITFKQYLKEAGFLSLSKTKQFLDPWFRFKLFSSAKFSRKKFDEDREKILEYYNSLGYRDAVIVADTQYITKKGNLNIDFKVEEGRKYYFGNISWKGNTKYKDSILSLVLGISKGDVYNLETLNKRLGKGGGEGGGDVGSLYQDDGYLFFQANPVETAVYNDTINYEIRIQEGPQATIDKVTIEGNDKTKEHVIRRELRTIPGEKFSRSDLIRSQREIVNLGYFNQEKLGMNFDPHPETGTVDIKYTVEEKSADQLELSAGWGGSIGLTGTLGVSFNNFSVKNILKKSSWDPLPTGDGQKLSLRIQSNGRAFRSYNFSFTEPWLGGKKRNSFSINYYNTKFSNAFDPLTGLPNRKYADSSYLKSQNIGISLGKQLKWPDDYFSLVYAINYTSYTLKNYPAFQQLNVKNGSFNNISFRLGLARTSIDQPIFPRNGSNFSLNLQFTPPYSLFRAREKYTDAADSYKWVEYHKWRFNGEWYVPIGKPMGADKNRQFVLKAAAKFGFLGKYSSFLGISPFERFQVGNAGLQNNFGIIGYDIIAQRGYPVYDNSDPRVNNTDQTSTNKYFTIFNKYVLEMRYPFSTNPSSTIYGLTFFEAANGWYDFKDYNPFKLRRSVGVGMRFFLPMFGLLGFDYGVGLDRLKPGGKLKDAASFTFMLGFEPE